SVLFSLLHRLPPPPTLFPYTTLFRSLEDRITVHDGSFEEIPFQAACFDYAWSQDSLLHSGDRARVLAEIDRVLKPGGEVIFTDPDRKSTRLNSSHVKISYAVFCLKKK